jgi:hypothetical protein
MIFPIVGIMSTEPGFRLYSPVIIETTYFHYFNSPLGRFFNNLEAAFRVHFSHPFAALGDRSSGALFEDFCSEF